MSLLRYLRLSHWLLTANILMTLILILVEL